jgi:hypothetical protein
MNCIIQADDITSSAVLTTAAWCAQQLTMEVDEVTHEHVVPTA